MQYRIRIEDDSLREYGVAPGDDLLIEETTAAHWRETDFIGRLVVVSSACGPMIGRYQPPHLVRAGDSVAMVSEMEIVGVVQAVMRELPEID